MSAFQLGQDDQILQANVSVPGSAVPTVELHRDNGNCSGQGNRALQSGYCSAKVIWDSQSEKCGGAGKHYYGHGSHLITKEERSPYYEL